MTTRTMIGAGVIGALCWGVTTGVVGFVLGSRNGHEEGMTHAKAVVAQAIYEHAASSEAAGLGMAADTGPMAEYRLLAIGFQGSGPWAEKAAVRLRELEADRAKTWDKIRNYKSGDGN